MKDLERGSRGKARNAESLGLEDEVRVIEPRQAKENGKRCE
jgi:hypothetical protein